MAYDPEDLEEEDGSETAGDEDEGDEDEDTGAEDDDAAIDAVVDEIETGAISFGNPLEMVGKLLGFGVPQKRVQKAAKKVTRKVVARAKQVVKPALRRVVPPKRGPLRGLPRPGASPPSLAKLKQMINFQQLAFVNDSVAATATESQTFTIQQDGLALAMYINPAAAEIVMNSLLYQGMPWVILGAQSASGWIATAEHTPPIAPKELRSGSSLIASVTNNAGAAVQLTWSIMGIPWQSLRSDAIPEDLKAYLKMNGYSSAGMFNL